MITAARFLTPPLRERRRSLAVAGTFVTLAVLAATVALIPNAAFVAVSAVYLGSFLAYLGLRTERSTDLFEIVGLLSVVSFLYFCIGTGYLMLVPDALEQTSLAPFLLPALLLATVGFLCLLVGYGWSFRDTKPSPLGQYAPAHILLCLIPTFVGALGLSVARIQSQSYLNYQGISSSLSFLQQFGSLFHFGWFVSWYLIFAKKLRGRAALLVMLPSAIAASLVLFHTLGSKSMAVIVLGMPALAFYQVKRKLPWKTALAIVLIFLFVVFPAYNTFRRVDRDLDTSRRLDRTIELARSWDAGEFMDASVFAFMKRITIVTSVAAIVSDTGRWVDYRYGETLLLTPMGLLIPRFIWPDKPNMSIGREFGAAFRFTNAMDRETEIAPSMVGELYWNFAVPGVIVGMWLLGAGYRWYYRRYGAGHGFDPLRKGIYAALLPTAIVFDGNVAIVVGGFVKSLIILVVFLNASRRLGWIRHKSEI